MEKKGKKFSFVKEKGYNADNLVIANIQKTIYNANSIGDMIEISETPYIFEGPIFDAYKEVQSEIMFYDKETKNTPFQIVNIESFTEIFNELSGKTVSKLDLLWYQNKINYIKSLKKEKKEEDGFIKALRRISES